VTDIYHDQCSRFFLLDFFFLVLLLFQARVVGASKGRLKSNLCSSFRKSKEDGWSMHKQMFTMEQYEFLQEYFLGGNYYA